MSPSRLSRRIAVTEAKPSGGVSKLTVRWVQPGFDRTLLELPQHLELMAARLQNGENIYAVFASQAGGQGTIAKGLNRLSVRLQLGESIESALEHFADEQGSALVREMANKITLGLRRGTPLAAQLFLLAAASRGQLKVAQLRTAGRNELKMLIPLVFLILPVTIAFAIFPSLQLLQLGF